MIATSRARRGPPFEPVPEWTGLHSRLVHGITLRGPSSDPFDLRLFGPAPAGEVLERWDRLRSALGFDHAVHARQVHGTRVLHHRIGGSGLTICGGADGHVTVRPGTLLTVSVADCVPVFLFDPTTSAIGLLHAGRKGVAGGILVEGLRAMTDRLGADLERLRVHLGPSICGGCYEVGPDVHEELGCPRPPAPTAVDLRAILRKQALSGGVAADLITASAKCTRCGPTDLFSHRAGDVQRQVAFLGLLDY